jgi:tetratricopeptide (TPR) repeat protein
MRLLTNLILGLFLSLNLFGQDDNVSELVSQGIALHDQGKYDDAITKYKMALKIDNKSTLANYELSYTYMVTEKYGDAIKYSKKVLEQNSENQHEAYIVLGSSLDMNGKADNAIKVYEEGLLKFPDSNLLNYNLALTSYHQKDYEKAERAAILAILAKPKHGSSHVILAAIMQAKGERVKSMLSTYYFLMLEPNSKRSKINYNSLLSQLGQGVERKNDKNISVNVPLSSSQDSLFGAAEMMVSLKAASRFIDENKDKSSMEFFIDTNKGFFSILGELKKENKDFWWDFYVPKFYDLVQSNNLEAFSYYISQSSNSEDINKYIAENADKMKQLKDWIDK